MLSDRAGGFTGATFRLAIHSVICSRVIELMGLWLNVAAIERFSGPVPTYLVGEED